MLVWFRGARYPTRGSLGAVGLPVCVSLRLGVMGLSGGGVRVVVAMCFLTKVRGK